MNVSKRARLAHVALLGSLLTYGSGSYTANTAEPIATPAGEYTTLLRSEEAKGVIKSMEKHRRRNGGNVSESERRYVNHMLDSANTASAMLRVPHAFIVSHWLMESGLLNQFSVNYNNLGGIKRGNALKRFNSLADFTNEYINILRRDRVQNLNNLQEFVIRLHNRHYFVGESVGSYKHKLEWHLSFVQAASRERNLFFGDLRWNGKELNMQEQVPVQERAAGELWHSFSEHSRDVPISMPRALIRY